MSRLAAAGLQGQGRQSFILRECGAFRGFEPRSERRESSGGVRSSWTPDVFDGRTNRIS